MKDFIQKQILDNFKILGNFTGILLTQLDSIICYLDHFSLQLYLRQF